MNGRDGNYVRFQDWKSEQSVDTERLDSDSTHSAFGVVSDVTGRTFEHIRGFIHIGSDIKPSLNKSKPKQKVLDPQGPFLQRWNKIFVISCVVAVSVDPLFFYIPLIGDSTCLGLDMRLGITASILRFCIDIFYILHIIFQFRTGFVAPSSRDFGRGVLVEDRSAIAKRYLFKNFLIDILAILPIPQVVILIILPSLQGPNLMHANNILMFIVIFQYVPRLLRIVPLYLQITRSAGIITETGWAGAGFNLLIYMIASHILGALWYLLAIQRENYCWKSKCQEPDCTPASLYCDYSGGSTENTTFLALNCPTDSTNGPQILGIYQPALQNVAQSTSFLEKLFYCFWWGLQNLSSLGQNLKTTPDTWENLFAVFVATLGLVLFALLIGNMQTFLQSNSLRKEEMRVKTRDAEQWMTHRMLPENIKERIRRYDQYRWQETRGVDEEQLLVNLPKDLRRDIKRHLCLSLLMRVPMFEKMDDKLLDAMCDRLKPVLYTDGSCIVREGDPVNEMLFLIRGNLESVTTNGGRTGFFNSDVLKAGDFCGEELLTWALDPTSSSSLPSSTRTVRTRTEVEAFALVADDLKFVATQFRRLHSKQLQHTFRLYSQQWRTWAACFIQAAWRRHCRRKMEEALHEKERKLQAAIVNDGSRSLSLGAALHASRFAGNLLRALRRNATRKARLQESIPAMLLQKPAEPDFFAEGQ